MLKGNIWPNHILTQDRQRVPQWSEIEYRIPRAGDRDGQTGVQRLWGRWADPELSAFACA